MQKVGRSAWAGTWSLKIHNLEVEWLITCVVNCGCFKEAEGQNGGQGRTQNQDEQVAKPRQCYLRASMLSLVCDELVF